jgi:hypothetical protein
VGSNRHDQRARIASPAGSAPEARLAKALTGLNGQPDKGDLFGVTMRARIHRW